MMKISRPLSLTTVPECAKVRLVAVLKAKGLIRAAAVSSTLLVIVDNDLLAHCYCTTLCEPWNCCCGSDETLGLSKVLCCVVTRSRNSADGSKGQNTITLLLLPPRYE